MIQECAPPAYTQDAPSSSKISLTVNGTVFTIDFATDPTLTPSTVLAQFIRSRTKWSGTKIVCYEGGCGACTVALTYFDKTQGKTVTRAAFSCLTPLLFCNGMSITTNDGLSGEDGGYHEIQKVLAERNGAQCGFCSNGFVMSMYALLDENPKPTPQEVEDRFDGNLCRCTGYRAILDAMKTFARTDERLHHHCHREGIFKDIEELVPSSRTSHYHHRPPVPHKGAQTKLSLRDEYQECLTVADLNQWLQYYTSIGTKVMLVVGQTSLSVMWNSSPARLFIGKIPELRQITQNDKGISIGSTATIANVVDYVKSCVTTPTYRVAHLAQAAKHLHCIGGHQLRNTACTIGNLMVTCAMQNSGKSFVSDVMTVFMGLGATATFYNPTTISYLTLSMEDLYTTDLSAAYCTAISIPWAAQNEKFMSYRIAKRRVNDVSYVNAAMRATVDPTTHKITQQPVVCYGGIFTKTSRIKSIEEALVGMDTTNNATFQTIATSLASVLKPSGENAPFRLSVALSFFYKYFLLLQPSLPSSLQSATECWMTKELTTGSEAFTPDPAEYPVSIGMPRMESKQLTSGRAVYTEDVSLPFGALHAVAVVATQGNCTIDTIDPSAAAKVKGFVAFFCAKDFDPSSNVWPNGEIFSTGSLVYAGQAIGVALGQTEGAAYAAANAVIVTYKDIKPVIVDLETAVEKGSLFPDQSNPPPVILGDVDAALKLCPHVVSGRFEVGEQYHFHLEGQVANVVPVEDTFEVLCPAQGQIAVQAQLAKILGIPSSKVIVTTKQCGGSFGSKLVNAMLPASIAALCASKLRTPVRIIFGLQENMASLGCRAARLMDYTVGFYDDGTISALKANVYQDAGAMSGNEWGSAWVQLHALDNCYKIRNVDFHSKLAFLHVPPRTAMRGPGFVPAIHLMESVVSRVASELQTDPKSVREKNFFKRGNTTADGMVLRFWTLPDLWSQLLQSADYTSRVAKIESFNASNRWTKRGIAVAPSRYFHDFKGRNYNTTVNVYSDGTISISHGGAELGQGINTKVAQICAYKFGLSKDDLALIHISDTSTKLLSGPRNFTGGSITSELCGLSVMHACEEINRRLSPFRQTTSSWRSLVSQANAANVDLSAVGWTSAPPSGTGTDFPYNTMSAAVVEVEVDVLSGQWNVDRVDIVFDCGISMNATLDIGQVQGGFMMGLGYYVLEDVGYDRTTGCATCNTTWKYKVPSSFDVPNEFNVTLLGNAPNPVGVLSSKACGEPPTTLGTTVVRALESALSAARSSAHCGTKPWVCSKTPLSVCQIQEACSTSIKQFIFQDPS